MKFQKKPEIVYAWQVKDLHRAKEKHERQLPRPIFEAFKKHKTLVFQEDGSITLQTTEYGPIKADPLDWIIEGKKGELSVCDFDVFEDRYDRLNMDFLDCRQRQIDKLKDEIEKLENS